MIKKVSFICIANYCRSPVAEKLLQKKCKNISVNSCGVLPLDTFEMDKRSLKYLRENNITDLSHIPSSPEKKLKDSDLVIVFEYRLIAEINKKFKLPIEKIKIYNFMNNDLLVRDPYRLEDEGHYFNEMDKIKTIVDSWAEYINESSPND